MKTISELVKKLFGVAIPLQKTVMESTTLPNADAIERKRQLVLARRAQRAKAK